MISPRQPRHLSQSLRLSASFFFRVQPLICRSHLRASSRVGNSSENTTPTGSLVDVALNRTSLMFCYPSFKIIGMPSVVGVIGAAQNINPETHVLSICFIACPKSSAASPLTCLEPFDTAQGERNYSALSEKYRSRLDTAQSLP
jgi:hypothetical protein